MNTEERGLLLFGYPRGGIVPKRVVVQVTTSEVAPRFQRGIDHNQYPKKRCTTCGNVKMKIEFHKSRGAVDGHSPTCSSCRNEFKREKEGVDA